MPSNRDVLFQKSLPLFAVSSGEVFGAFPELAVLFLPMALSRSLFIDHVWAWSIHGNALHSK